MNQHSTEALQFREAMSRVASSVYVVTTDGPAGRHGATATSITSLTDAPATLVVCLNRTSRVYTLAIVNGVIAVNLTGPRHEALARAFAASSRAPGDRRFDHGEWETLATGAPTLKDALVAFDGRIVDERVVGTHAALFVTLEAVRTGPGAEPVLLHHRRAYRPLAESGDD